MVNRLATAGNADERLFFRCAARFDFLDVTVKESLGIDAVGDDRRMEPTCPS
jgi:hypothetical protein